MGLTKQYLAYQPVDIFNVICSGRPNINFTVFNKIEGRYVVTGTAENAALWDLRLGEKVLDFKHEKGEVSALRVSPDRIHIAVGYVDGTVEIFNIETQRSEYSLALHKSGISILRYDEMGIRLVSGSLDNELVISDMISEIGKIRLVGHNAPITDAYFLENFDLENVVVSSSKDTQIKFWNLETQTCFKTIVDNRTEVWGLSIIGNYLISGTGENTMNVYRIRNRNENDKTTSANEIITPLVEGLSLDEETTVSPIIVTNCGYIQRAGKGRTMNLITDSSTNRVLICHGTGNIIEIFYFCTPEESKSRMMKRFKKLETTNKDNSNLSKEITLSDEIKRLPNIKITGTKIKSIDALIGLNNELRVVVSCSNNSIQLYSLSIEQKNAEPKLLKSLTHCGHQSEVRTICFSSDSLVIASGSGESLKVWNRESVQCIRTIPTDYILTSCFVPGDRNVLLGMKSGNVLITDISTGEILEEIPAHSKEVWSICLLPDLKGCATGSSDMTVKIWSFELIDNEVKNKTDGNEYNQNRKVLSLLHKGTLKLEESVLSVKISPNSKFIAVGLLDSTVKIFFLDSFKFYLSLYGHKLPILCTDISYDSNLIVTGSADRNVKIWGLDFGNCHRSLIAHDDSVMSLQFIPKTHLFFTCGKDGKIKQWDADTFEKIITLNGSHIGEAYSLCISPNGRYLITCGSDRTLRLFERTDEPIVLQDIQEEEREELENQALATGDDNTIPTLPGLKMPSRKTVGSEKAAESIIECLDICRTLETEDSTSTEIHPLMLALNVRNPIDFLVAVLNKIRASDLEEALIILPFNYVCQLLEMIPSACSSRNDQTETIFKLVIFLFRIHHKPIVSNQALLQPISNIIKHLEPLLNELRDMVGINIASLLILQREVENQDGIELFKDISKAKRQRDKKNRKRKLLERISIQMS